MRGRKTTIKGLMLFMILAGFTSAQLAGSSPMLDSIYQMPQNKIETRCYTSENKAGEKGAGGQSNFGRKGSPNTYLYPGKTNVLAAIEGSGTIRRIWFTLEQREVKTLRGLRIQMFWDGAEKPAVDAPLGDFFCQSHGTMSAFENIFFSSPEGRSFNCIVPMPFKNGAKIQIVNESDAGTHLFYEIDTTLGDEHGADMLYFHSSWRRENPTTLREDFTILPRIEGKGRFLGCHLGVIQNPSMNHIWWGEGEYKVYLDGDTEFPTLCGTGTEDLVGTGYGQGKFDHLYQGNHYLSEEGAPEGRRAGGVVLFADRHGYYRFHVPDPLFFYEDIRIEIQVMGGGGYGGFLQAMDKDPEIQLMKTGAGGEFWTREELENLDPFVGETVERIDDHFATAYWYMDSPINTLSPLAPYAQRVEGLEKDAPSYTQLISNGSFEAEPVGTAVVIGSTPVMDTSTFTDWRVFSVGTPPIEAFSVTSVANASDGNAAVRIDMTGVVAGGSGADYGLDQAQSDIPVVYGTNYLFSFDAARISGSIDLLLAIVEVDLAGVPIGNTLRHYHFPVVNVNYQNFSVEWTPSNPLVSAFYFRFMPFASTGSSVSLLLDHVQLDMQIPATLILEDLLQPYDGSAKAVSATTIPPGLAVDLTYDGSTNPSSDPGSYTVIGTINDRIYQGSTTNILVIQMPVAYEEWEALWFTPAQQTNPAISGPEVYFDEDAFNNWEEYISGTDPTDPLSWFEISEQSGVSGSDGFILNWSSISGRVYSVDWSPALVQGFIPLEANILWPQSSYTDQLHQAATEGFYYVDVYLPGTTTNSTITPGASAFGVGTDLFQSATITSHSPMNPAVGGFLAADMFSEGADLHLRDAIFADEIAGSFDFVEFNISSVVNLGTIVVGLANDPVVGDDNDNRSLSNIRVYASNSAGTVLDHLVADVAVDPEYTTAYGHNHISVSIDLGIYEVRYFRLEFTKFNVNSGSRIFEVDGFAR